MGPGERANARASALAELDADIGHAHDLTFERIRDDVLEESEELIVDICNKLEQAFVGHGSHVHDDSRAEWFDDRLRDIISERAMIEATEIIYGAGK